MERIGYFWKSYPASAGFSSTSLTQKWRFSG